MNKFINILLVLTIIVLVLVIGINYKKEHIKALDLVDAGVCGQGEGCDITKERYQGFETGEQIPDFTLTDFDGNETTAYELFEGKKKFVLSFAVDWCSDCERQDEKMSEYYDKLPDDYGFAVVFVDYTSSDGTKTTNKEQAKKYAQEKDYPFPVFWDEEQKISKKLGGIKATPTNLVIDEKFVIKAKTEEIDADILFTPNFAPNNEEVNKDAKVKE